jgi:hypothetical protein
LDLDDFANAAMMSGIRDPIFWLTAGPEATAPSIWMAVNLVPLRDLGEREVRAARSDNSCSRL